MNRLCPGDKPWVALVSAILDRRIGVFVIEGRLSATLIRLAVSDFAEFQHQLSGAEAVSIHVETLTRPEAANILGVTVGMVCAMIHEGHIDPPGKSGGRLSKTSVLKVAKSHIFTTEIARRLDTGPRWVRTAMRAWDIEPVFELARDRGFAFDRKTVETALESKRVADV